MQKHLKLMWGQLFKLWIKRVENITVMSKMKYYY